MSDHHPQGGNLFDMAKEGTKVPEDAAKLNVVPAGTKPSQKGEGSAGGLGVSDNTLGTSSLPEIVSAAGGHLPEDIGQKYSREGGKERGEQQTTPHGGRNQPSH
ncbi:hypothetical protein MMYC01_204515 [Madurella mycetomatis]|uniref:Uncharacterized protein n=1 Tax=Madurella mycetomatis TaxID=100816 RepID=A0A175W4V4_9PEZI|nr:hypothetical protein MMYC01_204515 [Madurella mycetomatis]